MGIDKYREIEDPDVLIDTLVADGLMIKVGVDEDGQALFELTEEGRKVIPAPSYEDRVKMLSKDAYDLWMLDMVEIRFGDSGPESDELSLTEHAFDKVKVAKLPPKLKYALSNMKKAFAKFLDS